MKTTCCTLALLALGTPLPAADPVSEAVASLGMLPNQRAGLRIAADERNPFAVRPKEIVKSTATEETETQESKIRSLFGQLRVTGIRRDRTGRHLALVGDLILRQGEEVKPVLEDQTEILIVSKIEPRQIELTFVENKDSTQPRVIVLPVKNQVQVAQKLFGQPKGKAGFYVARGRTGPDVEEAAAALAGAPPTAPATTSPLATVIGGPAAAQAAPAAVPAAPVANAAARDARREAAALAGLSESALAALVAGDSSSPDGPAVPAPAVASPPPPAITPPPQAVPSSPGPQPAANPGGEMVSPPTHQRRRTAPPGQEPASPESPGVLE